MENVQPKTVKVLKVQPHKVVIEFVETGRVVEFPRRSFERRIDMGLFEIANPQAMSIGL